MPLPTVRLVLICCLTYQNKPDNGQQHRYRIPWPGMVCNEMHETFPAWNQILYMGHISFPARFAFRCNSILSWMLETTWSCIAANWIPWNKSSIKELTETFALKLSWEGKTSWCNVIFRGLLSKRPKCGSLQVRYQASSKHYCFLYSVPWTTISLCWIGVSMWHLKVLHTTCRYMHEFSKMTRI